MPQPRPKKPALPIEPLRLGTRGSALARWQANWVADLLAQQGVAVTLVPITTSGDASSEPIGAGSSQGLFTKEIQRALLEEKIDLAVHSLKDLPTESVPGLALAAVPARENCQDALVTSSAPDLDSLPSGARVGTGSRRRQSQLLHHRPDLELLDIRGNVDTRLAKLDRGEYDAIILAVAGLKRLGLVDRAQQLLPHLQMLPAVGQGALGLEVRDADGPTRQVVKALDDPPSHSAVLAERALLRELRGGCLAPVGAWARMDQASLALDAVVLSPDGRQRLSGQGAGPASEPDSLGQSGGPTAA